MHVRLPCSLFWIYAQVLGLFTYGLHLERHKRNHWTLASSDFFHQSMCHLFKMRWIISEEGDISLPSVPSLEEFRVWLWFFGRPGSPRCTCTALLTWAVVVRVSVHTFQEGDSRQGWLPPAAFGRRQTTACREGGEWNEQFRRLTHPLLLSPSAGSRVATALQGERFLTFL